MRKIYAYTNGGECQVKDFFNRAEEKAVDKLMFQLEIIRDEKNGFLEPHIKHFSIERYRRLYEFRFRAYNLRVRVIFYEHNGELVLLYAFIKRDKKDTEKVLETAMRMLCNITEPDGEVKDKYKKELVFGD